MMKKLLAVTAVAGLAGAPVMADDLTINNPWTGNGAEVKVDVHVQKMAELWSNIGTNQARNGAANLDLQITNAAGQIPGNGKAQDKINVLSNIDTEVYVAIDNDIPELTRFHVIVNPDRSDYDGMPFTGTSNALAPTEADAIITWDRRGDGSYQGGNLPDSPVLAFTQAATGGSVVQTNVDYAVDAVHGMPEEGITSLQVVWTIAPVSP